MTFTDIQKTVIDASDTQVHLTVDFPNHEYTTLDEEIYYESMTLDESLIDQENLSFGKCNGSTFKVRCKAFVANIDGAEIEPALHYSNTRLGQSFIVPLGKFIVKTSERTANKLYRDIIATDYMSKFDVDVSAWYNDTLFPQISTTHTLWEVLTSLCNLLGVSFDTEANPFNKNFSVYKFVSPKVLKARDVLEDIFEIYGCFGHFDENGVLTLIRMEKSALYPSDNLFPADELYPRGGNREGGELAERISTYQSSSYDDFEVASVNSVAICDLAGNVIITKDADEVTVHNARLNRYSVVGNIFLVGFTEQALDTISGTLLSLYKHFSYRPNVTTVRGGIYYGLGHQITLHAYNDSFDSYVLKRQIQGICAIKTTLQATGTQYISNVEDDIVTQVTLLGQWAQNAVSGLEDELDDKVAKNTVSIELSNETGTVSITGNRLIVDSDNFKVNRTGDITAYGDITFKNNLKATNTRTGDTFNIISTSPDPNGTNMTINTLNGYYAKDIEMLYAEWGKGVFGIYAELDNSGQLATFGQIKGSSLQITGSKSRIVNTKDYNDRLLYCYETPSPLFGDVGHGTIGDDGKCYVYHDVILLETINTKQDYQVFLQSYAKDNVWVAEKEHDYFVVCGEPNTEFDWEIKAKQRDYEITRLEESQKVEVEQDRYEENAYNYLDSYEKELLL